MAPTPGWTADSNTVTADSSGATADGGVAQSGVWTADSTFTADSGRYLADGTVLPGPAAVAPAITLVEIDRLAGTVEIFWDAVAGALSYTIQNNEQDLLLNQTSPTRIYGLLVNISYRFKVVAYLAGGYGLQSNEIAFEYGSTEIMTVTPMARPGPYPYFPSVIVQ